MQQKEEVHKNNVTVVKFQNQDLSALAILKPVRKLERIKNAYFWLEDSTKNIIKVYIHEYQSLSLLNTVSYLFFRYLLKYFHGSQATNIFRQYK
jgi:hypothetical protein